MPPHHPAPPIHPRVSLPSDGKHVSWDIDLKMRFLSCLERKNRGKLVLPIWIGAYPSHPAFRPPSNGKQILFLPHPAPLYEILNTPLLFDKRLSYYLDTVVSWMTTVAADGDNWDSSSRRTHSFSRSEVWEYITLISVSDSVSRNEFSNTEANILPLRSPIDGGRASPFQCHSHSLNEQKALSFWGLCPGPRIELHQVGTLDYLYHWSAM